MLDEPQTPIVFVESLVNHACLFFPQIDKDVVAELAVALELSDTIDVKADKSAIKRKVVRFGDFANPI